MWTKQNSIRTFIVATLQVTEQGKKLLPCSGLAANEFLNVYIKKGYVTYEIDASNRTMDYADDVYCVALMTKALGKKDDYKYLMKRSENWKNIFNLELKYVVPKDSAGHWMKDYNPFSGNHFVEDKRMAVQLYVLHDIPDLINLIGNDLFNCQLEEGFKILSATGLLYTHSTGTSLMPKIQGYYRWWKSGFRNGPFAE